MKTLWLFIFIGLAYYAGWVRAHIVVATECKRLGKFYVGNETFECIKIERDNENE